MTQVEEKLSQAQSWRIFNHNTDMEVIKAFIVEMEFMRLKKKEKEPGIHFYRCVVEASRHLDDNRIVYFDDFIVLPCL